MPIAKLSSAKLNYLDKGTGKPLVFIHGLGANCSFYEPQIEYFSDTYRVISPELRGNGQSGRLNMPIDKILDAQCGDVAELMTLLGVEQAVLLGTSYGGAFCFNFALRYPERVTGLVIADSLAEACIRNFRDCLLKVVQYLGLWGIFLPKPLLTGIVKQQYKQWPYAQKHIAGFVRGMRKREFLYQLLALNRINYTSYLKQINCPALGLAGEQNKAGVIWMKEAMKEIPHSSLKIIPDSFDPSNLCQPAIYNKLVMDFLKEIKYT